MITTWIEPLLSWLGVGLIPTLLSIIIVVLILKK